MYNVHRVYTYSIIKSINLLFPKTIFVLAIVRVNKYLNLSPLTVVC